MFAFFQNLDRRWIFLMMLLAVAVPSLLQLQFPETPSAQSQVIFDAIDELPDGSSVLLAFDYDPASEGELAPMATAFTRHCIEKKHKMYFMAIFSPASPQMIEDTIQRVIKQDAPELVYGEDYVNLGYKPGYEGVVKVVVTDLKQLYTTDVYGTSTDKIPMTRDIQSVQDFDLLIDICAGYAGMKEWVQYAVTPYPNRIKMVGGCTGVQYPLFLPYVPDQIPGLLGAIKGAAEYEKLVVDRYDLGDDGKYAEGRRRMGPQLIAHLLMVGLIVAGNVIYFMERRREVGR